MKKTSKADKIALAEIEILLTYITAIRNELNEIRNRAIQLLKDIKIPLSIRWSLYIKLTGLDLINREIYIDNFECLRVRNESVQEGPYYYAQNGEVFSGTSYIQLIKTKMDKKLIRKDPKLLKELMLEMLQMASETFVIVN